MKHINVALLLLALPLNGCASRPDYTLNPPARTEWVNVTVELPPYTEVAPMDVLYRSDKCQREVYDEKIESHRSLERGKNPRVVRMIQQGNSNIWHSRIASDGGGKCEWKLSVLRIDIQPVHTLPLAKEKKLIQTSYAFSFDSEDYVGGGGVGIVRKTQGDLTINTVLFPMVVINHALNKQTLRFFAGDVD